MSNPKEILIDFLKWYKDNYEYCPYGVSYDFLIDEYLKSINISSRRSERRAIGSNSKAKEVCADRKTCEYYKQFKECIMYCDLFKPKAN